MSTLSIQVRLVTSEVVETLNHHQMVKKIELWTLRGDGDVKLFNYL